MSYTTAYFYLTNEGGTLAERLAASHPGIIYGKKDFKENLRAAFARYDNLVCIMAAGIVVRILAPLIEHKTSDPAVVVMDQRGQFAISLLSGHLGGANDLAREMAALSGGQPVITTATDVAGKLSFDSFAKKHNLAIQNIEILKYVSGALLAGERVLVLTDRDVETQFPELKREEEADLLDVLPLHAAPEIEESPNTWSACVVIDEGFSLPETSPLPALYLRPRTICAGIGCKRDMAQEPIEEALLATLKKEGLHPLSLRCIATIPLKADEPGILETAARLCVPLKVIPTEEIATLDIAALGIAASDFVAAQTGVLSVSTACSYLASRRGQILRDKEKYKGITVALSRSVSLT